MATHAQYLGLTQARYVERSADPEMVKTVREHLLQRLGGDRPRGPAALRLLRPVPDDGDDTGESS